MYLPAVAQQPLLGAQGILILLHNVAILLHNVVHKVHSRAWLDNASDNILEINGLGNRTLAEYRHTDAQLHPRSQWEFDPRSQWEFALAKSDSLSRR